MAFRFDMQNKTPQQQVIVAQRDAENKRIKDEQKSNEMQKSSTPEKNTGVLLVIDKDTCPKHNNIITKNQCKNCPHYLSFEMYQAQPCVCCTYNQDGK